MLSTSLSLSLYLSISLSLLSLSLSPLSLSHRPPCCSNRCDHGCCVVGSKMYVSCGSGGENVWYSDLYYLDLRTLEWTKVEMEGNSPKPRDYLTLCSLSNLVSHQQPAGHSDCIVMYLPISAVPCYVRRLQ